MMNIFSFTQYQRKRKRERENFFLLILIFLLLLLLLLLFYHDGDCNKKMKRKKREFPMNTRVRFVCFWKFSCIIFYLRIFSFSFFFIRTRSRYRAQKYTWIKYFHRHKKKMLNFHYSQIMQFINNKWQSNIFLSLSMGR